jgi:hypothetical protein
MGAFGARGVGETYFLKIGENLGLDIREEEHWGCVRHHLRGLGDSGDFESRRRLPSDIRSHRWAMLHVLGRSGVGALRIITDGAVACPCRRFYIFCFPRPILSISILTSY